MKSFLLCLLCTHTHPAAQLRLRRWSEQEMRLQKAAFRIRRRSQVCVSADVFNKNKKSVELKEEATLCCCRQDRSEDPVIH